VKHVAAASLALSLTLFPAGAAPAERPPEGPPARVRLVDAGPTSAPPWVAASLAAARRATLSTRISASVRLVRAEEGARVSAGQLLVGLSDGDIRAQLAAAETALATAELNEKRFAALSAQRAATPSELEMARSQRSQAAAAVAGARASLGYAEIRAPFAGTVQARRVQVGDLVGPGQPLVEIEGTGLELQATLSEEEAAALAVGRELSFRSGEREGKARVTALSPGGDPASHRRSLRALVLGGAEGMRSGSFARLELPAGTAAPSGAWVPRSALVQRGDLTGLFVAEGGRAQLRWVALGEPVGDRFPVRAGLRAGEPVIDAPGALRDGQAIEVSRGQ
jgi:membrane fusion protein (multidrug efflux system)